MSQYQTLKAKLDTGQTIILDGGMGSELERRGVAMDQEMWSGLAMETNPDIVTEAHRSYLDAGADVITTNSYATPPVRLRAAGHGDKVELWNKTACNLALQAREGHERSTSICVAGSVSTYGSWDGFSADELRPGFAEQARLLSENGVDFLIVESLAADPEIILAAVEESQKIDLPLWVSISCMQDRGSGKILHGSRESAQQSYDPRAYGPLEEVVATISDYQCDAILLMHSEFTIANDAIKTAIAHAQVPLGIYPNIGYWKRPNWTFIDKVEPEKYADAAMHWIKEGAQIVGGCCGVGPEHIEAVAKEISNS